MADVITIDTKGFNKGVKQFEALIKRFPERVDDVMNKSALQIEKQAKTDAPANNGQLRQLISADVSLTLIKRITVATPYAAFMEFGTGAWAAQYVSTLPAEYKAYAAQFKGGGKKPSIKGMMYILMKWFERKGIKDKQHQYFIAKKIIRNGVHPHPFLIPAVIKQKQVIIKDMQTMLNKLSAA